MGLHIGHRLRGRVKPSCGQYLCNNGMLKIGRPACRQRRAYRSIADILFLCECRPGNRSAAVFSSGENDPAQSACPRTGLPQERLLP